MKKRTLKVYAELIEVARARGIITYGDLAERCGCIGPMAAMNVKHALNDIREAEAGSGRRPALDALVVSKHDGAPGYGYNEGDEDAWRDDVEAVYAEWSTLDGRGSADVFTAGSAALLFRSPDGPDTHRQTLAITSSV